MTDIKTDTEAPTETSTKQTSNGDEGTVGGFHTESNENTISKEANEMDTSVTGVMKTATLLNEGTNLNVVGNTDQNQNDSTIPKEKGDGDNTQINAEINNRDNPPKEKGNDVNTQTNAEVNNPDNPLKRKRCRPPKRKRKERKHGLNIYTSMDNDNTTPAVVPPENDQGLDTSLEVGKEDVEYCLTVSNLPNNWSFMDVKNYIDTECGPVDEIEMITDNETGKGAIRLSYETEEECKEGMEKLKDKEILGNKLTLEMTVVSLESDSETEPIKKPWKPDLDSWDVDDTGLYGLKTQFLKSLGITPPLDRWVHVSNFRCDKSELREVLDMAGNVQMCSMFTMTSRYAHVMYSHPLEAVQAVSMLNNQMFYGLRLKVQMDRSPSNTVLLPKGLSSIGQGLGLYGKPLRNIVKHYERFVGNKECWINPRFFEVPMHHSIKMVDEMDATFDVKSVEVFNDPVDKPRANVAKSVGNVAMPVGNVATTVSAKSTVSPKPIQSTPAAKAVQTPAYTIAKSSPKPTQSNFTPPFEQSAPFQPHYRPGPFLGPNMMDGGMGPQGPPHPMGPAMPMMQPGPGVDPSQFQRPFMPQGPPGPGPFMPQGAPGPGPFMPQGPPGPGPVWGPPGPMQGPMFANEPVKLILSNLPPSTTFPLLCEKMSEWGHVVSIQLSTPGCAVVTFANRMQADGCFKHYNGRNIENYFIQVKYA